MPDSRSLGVAYRFEQNGTQKLTPRTRRITVMRRPDYTLHGGLGQ